MIFSENVRQTVYEISLIRRDIIAFRRMIKPQISVIAGLDRRAVALAPLLGEDLSEYFGDLNDHLAKIWDTLEDYKDVIEGLSDTNNSLTNTRINDVIKVLTILSVILLPLTLVSGIYGMNFADPAVARTSLWLLDHARRDGGDRARHAGLFQASAAGFRRMHNRGTEGTEIRIIRLQRKGVKMAKMQSVLCGLCGVTAKSLCAYHSKPQTSNLKPFYAVLLAIGIGVAGGRGTAQVNPIIPLAAVIALLPLPWLLTRPLVSLRRRWA